MIPIAKPFLDDEEVGAVREAIISGWVTQGPKVLEFENAFAKFVGSSYACAVSSCTTGLHLALMAVGVSPGDVVITVSHSFIATANAVRYCGAEPVFADIDAKTFNMSPESLELCLRKDCESRDGDLYYRDLKKVTTGPSPLNHAGGIVGRVAAVMPVHQMGMPCDMKKIGEIAKRHNLPVVEDAACAIGSEINVNGLWERIGKPHSDVACFSFHPRKVMTTGEGGMLTTNNERMDKSFRLLRHHGMDVSDLTRHNAKKVVIEKYTTTGFNYRMSDIHASVGIKQLEKMPTMLERRREIAAYYVDHLKNISWIDTPEEPSYCRSNWQSYPVTIKGDRSIDRDGVISHLLDMGISTRPGIMNAHGEKPYALAEFSLPISDRCRDRVLLLPMYYGLSSEEMKKIVTGLKGIGE